MMTTSSFPNSDSNNSQHTHSNTITDTRLSMQQDTIPTFSSKKSENKAPVENELEEKESEYQMIAKVPSEESREDSDQESLSLRQDTINDQESEQVPVIDERKTRLSTTGSRKKINQDNHDSSSQSSIDTEDQDENLSIASIPRQSTRPRRSSIPRQPSTQDIVDTKTEGPSSSSGRKITLRHSKRRGSLSSLNSTSTSTAPGPKTLVTDGRTSQQLKKKINGKQPPNTVREYELIMFQLLILLDRFREIRCIIFEKV